MAGSDKPKKKFMPRWDEIMKVLATPKQEVVYSNRSANPADWDGAWDFQAAQRGLGMRRVAADIGRSDGEIQVPHGFVFVCDCGYARRVVDSEHAFTCERPNDKGGRGCGILWQVEVVESDEINEKTGEPIWKPKLEERQAPNGRKYMMPVIKGGYANDFRRETWEARKKAGKPADEPQVPLPIIVPDTDQEESKE